MTAFDASVRAANPALVASAPAVAPASAVTADDADDGFSFDDLIDMVNPLQHIPVVGTLYRAITGDQIHTAPKILGDTLYGGITGFVGSVADTIFEKVTGKNVGDTMLALVEDIFSSDEPAMAVADAAPAATPDATAATPAASTQVAMLAPPLTPAVAPGTGLAVLTPPQLQIPTSAIPAQQDAIIVPGQDELLMALSRNGIGQDVALRAAEAYRRTLNAAQANALQ